MLTIEFSFTNCPSCQNIVGLCIFAPFGSLSEFENLSHVDFTCEVRKANLSIDILNHWRILSTFHILHNQPEALFWPCGSFSHFLVPQSRYYRSQSDTVRVDWEFTGVQPISLNTQNTLIHKGLCSADCISTVKQEVSDWMLPIALNIKKEKKKKSVDFNRCLACLV